MNVTTELLQLLSEVGYMACFRGDSERAQVIMDGVDAVGDEQTPIKMGLAITKIYAGDLDDAISILRDDVLNNDPEHMSAKCFLGIALNLKGNKTKQIHCSRKLPSRVTTTKKVLPVSICLTDSLSN